MAFIMRLKEMKFAFVPSLIAAAIQNGSGNG